MRRVLLEVIVLFLLRSASVFSNPYILTLINEVQSSPDSLEAIELHWTPELPDVGNIDLGGWFVTTSMGTAYIVPGVVLSPTGYVVINSSNTYGEFSLNDSIETISIHSSDFPDPFDSISVFLPPEGKSVSLCNEFLVDPNDPWSINQVVYFYWDSSPTMGYENDDQHSRGVVKGMVRDRNNQPVSGALIVALFRNFSGWFKPDSVITDSDGQFEVDKLIPGPYRLTAQIDTLSDTLWVDVFSRETTSVVFPLPFSGASGGYASSSILPQRLLLFPNYPNPFNSSTKIRYFLPRSGLVRLAIYDILGRRVATLFTGFQNAGYKSLSWEPKGLFSGIYLCRIWTLGEEATQKIVLLQ